MWLVATLPFVFATIGPLVPLLIIIAGTLPPEAPHVSERIVWTIAAVLAAAVIASLLGLVLRGAPTLPRELWLPLGALLASQLLALAWGIDPAAGIFGIATTLGGMVALVASHEVLAEDRTRRRFLACYFISASAAALFAVILSIMRLPPSMYSYEHGRASGTFLQPNEFAGYLLFVIPIGFAQLTAPRWLRAIGLVAAVLGTIGLSLSVSRAAMVSLILALPIFVRRFGLRAVLPYGAVAVVCLLLMTTSLRNVAHDPSENASRIAVWSSSMRLAQRFALTGVGPFGFHLAYPALKRPEVSVNELHAHDLPLQILIEDGVLGLAAFAWFALAATRQVARSGAAIPAGDRERLLLFTALVTGFTASALQNLVDVVTTFLLIVAWPMLGLALALGRHEPSSA
jgi:putative inorganic carbon (HCO3(-)) transporter